MAHPRTSPLDARNRLGGIVRHHPDDLDAIEAARRSLAEAKLADYIERTIETFPPLTDEQCARLARMLRSDGAA